MTSSGFLVYNSYGDDMLYVLYGTERLLMDQRLDKLKKRSSL